MNLRDKLNDDDLKKIAEAQEQDRAEKEAAERKARRASTKYGSLLEDGK